jgi:signal transduction histidine kinase
VLRDPDAEILRLRTALRDLVALSTIPAAWVGKEPSAIAAGLADVLAGSLYLDFAFVRLCDPRGGATIEMTRGNAWKAFPEWLQRHLAVVGQLSRKEIIPDLGGAEPSRGIVVPIGINAEGGLVAAASNRTDFPTEIDQLLLSVAANHAATAFQSARLEQELRQARTELEIKVVERTAELRRAATYLAEAQRVSHTGSFAWNVSSGEIFWSDEMFRIYGYDPTTAPSLEMVLRRIHPDDRALAQQFVDGESSDAPNLDDEYRLLMPDGTVKYIRTLRGRAGPGFDGGLTMVGTVMDVTERKRAEEALRQSEQRLRQAEKMEAIGRLAGGIAHDFNNILGAILGYGELAQKNLEGRAVRRHIDQVMQAGARGKGLVERILAFSRSGLGERAPVHVQSVVEEALEILAASLASSVRLERQLDAGDTAVVGDATQLHQVAMNLCTNALQAMEHGGVLTVLLDRVAVPERRLLSHSTLSPGDYVRLSVSDTGSGILPAVLERMFDAFFTTKGVGDGTGLGLSLVHGIVADLGGAIDVATQAGVGTTFTVWLPAAGETPRLLTEPVGELPQGNGETVMIIDDQRSLVALAEEMLAVVGYEPVGFDSSVAALQAFRAEPQRFDLVLTDETMPDMSGVELAREIRCVRPDLPIVLMSGYSGAQLTERARAAGVAELLHKPLMRRDIAEALGRVLRPTG